MPAAPTCHAVASNASQPWHLETLCYPHFSVLQAALVFRQALQTALCICLGGDAVLLSGASSYGVQHNLCFSEHFKQRTRGWQRVRQDTGAALCSCKVIAARSSSIPGACAACSTHLLSGEMLLGCLCSMRLPLLRWLARCSAVERSHELRTQSRQPGSWVRHDSSQGSSWRKQLQALPTLQWVAAEWCWKGRCMMAPAPHSLCSGALIADGCAQLKFITHGKWLPGRFGERRQRVSLWLHLDPGLHWAACSLAGPSQQGCQPSGATEAAAPSQQP